jgi:uncharacterized membrane protein YgcG
METTKLQPIAAVMAIAALVWTAPTAFAQESSASNTIPSVAFRTSAPPLAADVGEVLRLAQAKIGTDTIIAYIKNSGNSYDLNADQIIYLRQQGISDAVIVTMLTQARPVQVPATASNPAQPPTAATAYDGQVTPPPTAPSVTYVPSTPAVSYYYQPDYEPYYYYPDYYAYPLGSFSFGWYGGYYGGGYRGGYRGGYGGHGGGYGGGAHGGGHGGGHR